MFFLDWALKYRNSLLFFYAMLTIVNMKVTHVECTSPGFHSWIKILNVEFFTVGIQF